MLTEDCEADEPDCEHDQGDTAHCDDEITPSHIFAAGADFILLACQVTKQGPGDQRGHHLGDGPVDAENSEEI